MDEHSPVPVSLDSRACVYDVVTKERSVALIIENLQNAPQVDRSKLEVVIENRGIAFDVSRGLGREKLHVKEGSVVRFRIAQKETGFSIVSNEENASVLRMRVTLYGEVVKKGKLLEVFSDAL